MSKIEEWLEEAGSKPGVSGAMIIDKTNGLCLGLTGRAQESEAALLKYRFETENTDGSDTLQLESDGCYIWMFDQPRSLVALYTDISGDEDSATVAAAESTINSSF